MFMAVELEIQAYFFEPLDSRDRAGDTLPYSDLTEGKGHLQSVSKSHVSVPHKGAPTPFRYNPLHDLESLWWIAAFFLFKRDVALDEEDACKPAERTRRQAQTIAAENLFNISRSTLLADFPVFPTVLTSLHPSVQPIGRRLEDLRKELVETYRNAEKDPSTITHTVADSLHARFRREFADIVTTLRTKPVAVESLPFVSTPGRKRPRQPATPERSPKRPCKRARVLAPPSPRITRARAAVLANRNT